jgi:hypothetical protein
VRNIVPLNAGLILTVPRHSVVAFVRSNLPAEIRRANFVTVLEWLKNISDKDDPPLQEACIMTLCGLAMYVPNSQNYLSSVPLVSQMNLCSVSEDEEKNIILLRLLEYLGHTNPYVCAVAYNEVSLYDRDRFAYLSSLRPRSAKSLQFDLAIQTRTTIFHDACRPVSTLLENPFGHCCQKPSISPVYGRAAM